MEKLLVFPLENNFLLIKGNKNKEVIMEKTFIYHKPTCSKSRQGVKYLEEKGSGRSSRTEL